MFTEPTSGRRRRRTERADQIHIRGGCQSVDRHRFPVWSVPESSRGALPWRTSEDHSDGGSRHPESAIFSLEPGPQRERVPLQTTVTSPTVDSGARQCSPIRGTDGLPIARSPVRTRATKNEIGGDGTSEPIHTAVCYRWTASSSQARCLPGGTPLTKRLDDFDPRIHRRDHLRFARYWSAGVVSMVACSNFTAGM